MEIQERFEDFDRENPEIYKALVLFARQIKSRGFQTYGIRSLWERTRWHFQVEKAEGADFKMNDHFHSRYARKIMENESDLAGFFETRVLRAA